MSPSGCKVIGVLAYMGASALGRDYDETVLMPLTTVRRKLMNLGGALALACLASAFRLGKRLDLALLAPGVAPANLASTQLFPETSAVPGQGLAVSSQRNLSNGFIVDGLSANDDAAGVAVAVEVARRLAAHPLPRGSIDRKSVV